MKMRSGLQAGMPALPMMKMRGELQARMPALPGVFSEQLVLG
jgi:hypothetical protein